VADYATTADLTALGVSTDVLSDVEDAQKEAVITARSRFADGYLAVRYTIPDGGLTAFTGDLTWAVVQLACYDLVTNYHRYTTDKPNEDSLRKRHDDAIKWLEAVRDGEISPAIADDDDDASTVPGAPVFVSSTIRGWTSREAD
jgi:phage gp36-like protein